MRNFYIFHLQLWSWIAIDYSIEQLVLAENKMINDYRAKLLLLLKNANNTKCTERKMADFKTTVVKSDFFFGMNPEHMSAVSKFSLYLKDQKNMHEMICAVSKLKKGEMNPNIWFRGLLTVILNNPLLSSAPIPSLVETFPTLVVPSSIILKAKQMASISQNNQEKNECNLVLDGSEGKKNGLENKLWYFREDVMINSQHFYWHLTYPFTFTSQKLSLPRKDRRGELFYYYHKSIINRYESERLSNGLRSTVSLELNKNTFIKEGYYANLDGTNSGLKFTDRLPNSKLSDVIYTINNETFTVKISMLLKYYKLIVDAIEKGKITLKNNKTVSINNLKGIDLLDDITEASIYSINPKLYGRYGVHNFGHWLIGLVQDPFHLKKLPPGVMADTGTAMRDPIFYRLHTFINDIYEKHKSKLSPYYLSKGKLGLKWDGVKVKLIQILSGPFYRVNELRTFFNEKKYDLSIGLDFHRNISNGPINLCVKHLDYENFKYKIILEKSAFVKERSASVRIFMAHKLNENGSQFSFNEQRKLFFPLDFFRVKLKTGINIITRSSADSSLTIGMSQSLDELLKDKNNTKPYCGCGWPQNLLLPKGTKNGMKFDIFVMITNGKNDAVKKNKDRYKEHKSCKAAFILCGIVGQLYPDKKPMGYPLDRPIDNFKSFKEFTSSIPNSGLVEVNKLH